MMFLECEQAKPAAPWRALVLACGVLAAVPLAAAARAEAPPVADAAGPATPVGQALARMLTEGETPLASRWIDGETLETFYTESGFAPIWTGSPEATARAEGVLAMIRDAEVHGLDPADYGYPGLVARLDATDAQMQAELELLLSAAYVRFYGDLGEGMVSPEDVHPEEYDYRPRINALGLLHAAAASDDAAEWLRLAAPGNRLYVGLLAALQTYRQLVAEGGWPALPDGESLEPGQSDERVPLLRERLRASGDYVAPSAAADGITPASLGGAEDPNLYDAALADALRSFQARHGLAEDGVLGPRTLAALNVPVEERLTQILINLERVRWMPGHLGDRYILVNVAGYSVEVVEDGRTVLQMAAIVGEDEWQTPVFSDVMRYIEFNPYWNIPPSIAEQEIAPKVMSDWSYLERQGIRVLDDYVEGAREYDPAGVDWSNLGESSPYRLRQDPGPRNPLGNVKFMFPNAHAIYLHDTPGDQLFDRTQRAFSHGCIRVAEPLALAVYLLQGQDDWNEEKIAATLEGDSLQRVDLERTLPVHLAYLTAWVDDDGRMHFRDDVYGRDGALVEALLQAKRAHGSALDGSAL